ncbi:MAG TPA: hypothetical protein VN616_13280 [Puia sp.]|nr:hypothetical protein [Puia sp.]
MFAEIFLFEIRTRIRRPAVYLYFTALLVFTCFAFSTGSLPVGEREHINSPYLISFWCAGMTMMMALVSSSVMGMALFRDIEFQTKDYYLTYPITRPGYFWGRFFGSFFFMVLIALAIPLGIWLSTHLGPAIGKALPARYGPNLPMYYIYPFLVIALPNLFFTSALFYGLVAVLRNVKVIYFGGLLLFLFYFIALFFLNTTNNASVIAIADPFALNGVRARMLNANYIQQNGSLLLFHGPMVVNRLLWPGLSLLVLLVTYLRFNFETFFAGRRDRAVADEVTQRSHATLRTPALNFAGNYNRRTLGSLVRLELLNIIRDNYFWVIVGVGGFFLGFVFWQGMMNWNVRDLPRTVMLLAIFKDAFPFFIFFIIMFYTGETLHRDRITRYSFINDSLPPPNWVFNGSKLIPILIISAGLAFLPMVVGILVQLLKGYPHLNLAAWFDEVFILLLPNFLAGAVLCYLVQVVFNNKFAGYAIVSVLWIGMFFLDSSGVFNYHLLLYPITPDAAISDMDGMGHMIGPVSWFNLYWTLGAGLLVILAALLYNRGLNTSLKERGQLIPERFNRATGIWTLALGILFLAAGGYIYYNVSYLNEWLTKGEQHDRAVIYERSLKKYQQLPLPKMTALTEWVDLYPEKKEALVHALVTIGNRTGQPIRELLLDGDALTSYSLALNGKPLPYSSPLFYPRGVVSWFRPAKDTAPFRLYQFPTPLAPGDSMVLELRSAVSHRGFSNGRFAVNMLDNGTLFTGGLPGLGYDDDDELSSPYERQQAGLPPKPDEEIAQDDPAGRNNLRAGAAADLVRLDMTVSVPGDQTAVSPGELVKQWQSGGRNYFHYVLNKPGLYAPYALACARYAVKTDSIMLDHPVDISIYYDPRHGENVDRFMTGYKDGLEYYSKAYGNYPFPKFVMAETSNYGPRDLSLEAMDTHAEPDMWNAHFTDPGQVDFIYHSTAYLTAQQWWRYCVAPNSTVGSMVISEGLANYDALVLDEKHGGQAGVRPFLDNDAFIYKVIRRRLTEPEHVLVNANDWFEWNQKAAIVLYGLRQLIGPDSMDAALREFRDSFDYRSHGPFAGANDLYAILKKHVPDSLQYYLTDTWLKNTEYNNTVEAVSVKPAAGPDEYTITARVSIDKSWLSEKGNDIPATGMKDYIDLAVLGEPARDAAGRRQPRYLYRQRYRLGRGEHTFTLVVKGKPKAVAIDPLGYLIDVNRNDNVRQVE